ncbi:MAG TPA: hypothetical protein VMV05_08590 [bacterium]|nr:hypothetical protein [bacterium]
MPSRQYLLILAVALLLWMPSGSLKAQTATPTNTRTNTNTRTPTGTPTNTRTATHTSTPTGTFTLTATRTPTGTPTDTFTPNPSNTPPCGSAVSQFGISTSASLSSAPAGTAGMRASIYTLSQAASVYTMALYCSNAGATVQTAIYSAAGGTSYVSNILTQSAPQTVYDGWNFFQVTPTVLNAGSYWLAYQYNANLAFYIDYSTNPTGNTTVAYATGAVTMGNFPNYPPMAYGNDEHDALYAGYCRFPTNTPTNTWTPTYTGTPTGSYTPTGTPTATATPTFPTHTFTNTPTSTATVTPTLSPTPNPSWTPDCNPSSVFGNSNTVGLVTGAGPVVEMRACRYTLPVDAVVETISLYSVGNPTGTTADVALYASVPNPTGTTTPGTTIGTLICQSDYHTQGLNQGWNVFKIPNASVTAGEYWLAYAYGSPTTNYSISWQTSPSETNSMVWTVSNSINSTFPLYASSWGVTSSDNIHDAIYANYCPSTPTNTFTITFTPTATSDATTTDTPTNTATGTSTLSPTHTATFTPSGTSTNSATSTDTGTPTPTATLTASSTPTSSPTLTGTPTQTFTATATFTLTNSPTVTSTYTPTPTPTITNTPNLTFIPTFTSTVTSTFSFTSSATSTPTASASPTPTVTPTLTPTNSASSTVTTTPTVTATNSPTNTGTVLTSTPTNTFTASFTPSATPPATSSPTATATVTSSWTATYSATPSATFTASKTLTSTPADTATNSPTGTPTPAVLISESVSTGYASAGTLLTYTITLNVANGNVSGLAITDSLPPGLVYTSLITSPLGTFNSTASSYSWTLPSPLAPGNYQLVYQAEIGVTVACGTILTDNPQLVYASQPAPQSTNGSVTVQCPGTTTPSPGSAMPPAFSANPIHGGPVTLTATFDKPHDYVSVKVFTTAFRKVYEHTDQAVPAGIYQYSLDTDHFRGGEAGNGLYYVVISTPANRWISKLLVLR